MFHQILEGKVSASGAGFNIVPVTQSWNGAHETIAGLIPFTDSSSTEFYNGEYSGSTIVVTSQSLLNNPYTVDPNQNINYTVAITSSTGQYSYTYDSVIDTYPSFSMNFQFYTKNANNTSNYFKEYFDAWGPSQSLEGTGSIWMTIYERDKTKWVVNGIQFPNASSTLGSNGFLNTDEPGEAFGLEYASRGYYPSNWSLIPRIDIPNPPRSGSGLDLLTQETYSIQTNNVGPYFKMDISGSLNPYFADREIGAGNNYTIQDNNQYMGGLSDNVIISTMLGDTFTIEKSAGYVGTAGAQQGLVKYWYNDAPIRHPRTVQTLDAVTGQPAIIPSGTSNQAFTGSIQIDVYISNYDNFNYDANLAYSTPYSLPAIGSASLNLIGTTWTGSFSDYGLWSPLSFIINNRSIDPITGLEIDNIDTLVNYPDFTFEIDNYISTEYLTPTNFTNYENILNGVVSYQSPSYLSSTGFRYTPSGSQHFSGSRE